MSIPIQKFEQYISEKILKRGLRYYQDGHVVELQELSQNHYELHVEGSEDYTVEIELENKHITHCSCTCPYDREAICKHITAAIFYLLEVEWEEDVTSVEIEKPSKRAKTAKKGKNKTAKASLQEMLEQISLEELRAFVVENALHSKTFKNVVIAHFAHYNEEESIGLYKKRIKAAIENNVGNYGYADWSTTRKIGKELERFYKLGRTQLKKENLKSAFFIAFAIWEEAIIILRNTDDRDGDVEVNVKLAIDILEDLAKQPLPELLREMYLERCLKNYKEETIDWDWHFKPLELAANISKTEQEASLITKILDTTAKSGWALQEAQILKYKLIKKIKGEAQAADYLNKHLDNFELRHVAIQKAVNEKQYETAIRYAQAGIQQDKNERPGYLKKWYNWLLKIAQIQKDRERIIQYAQRLFVRENYFSKQHYKILKQQVDTKEWPSFLQKLIAEIKRNRSWGTNQLLAEIYITEKYWDKLLQLVQQHPSLEYLEEYEKYLKRDHSKELVKLYMDIIPFLLGRYQMNRNFYQEVCRYLRRVKKLGGGAEVVAQINSWRASYPKHRALLEELDKV
jgi:uncharacterized Zn finger protein